MNPRAPITLALCLAASFALLDCGAADSALTGAMPGGESCDSTRDCGRHNEVCGLTVDANGNRRCAPPTGACNPEIDVAAQCYEGARCDTTVASSGGRCTFRSPPRPSFTVGPRVTVESPTADAVIEPARGVSFRWQPPSSLPTAVAVAAVMRAPPRLEPGVNRILNRDDVVWIWSSAFEGATGEGATAGSVAARWGFAGVDRDGNPRARWGRDTLDAGVYWWFAYAIVEGRVAATSVATRFYVGEPPSAGSSCVEVTQCAAPGDDPERFACVDHRCVRRCASEVDCPEAGTRCAFDQTLGAIDRTGLGRGIVRGAYCARIEAVDGGADAQVDAGNGPDAAPPEADAGAQVEPLDGG